MESLREALRRITIFFSNWCNFTILLVHVTIGIPLMIVACVIFIVAPAVYLVVAVHAPLWATAYMFAVFVGVGLYCILHYDEERNALEDPEDGRSITTEGKATSRGRSKIRDSFLDE